MNRILSLLVFLFSAALLPAQTVLVEGYVYEEGNRGYLNQVNIHIYDVSSDEIISSLSSDKSGFFNASLPINSNYRIDATKSLFEKKSTLFDTNNKKDGEKLYIKIEMEREPGYIFDVTMAPKRENEDVAVEAIQGALVEVYNNSRQEEVLSLENHPNPDFKVHFKKGNHYTVLIRKEGFLAKRMEAFVNVEGCILCFEGVGEVRPAVVDNLTEGLEMGTLLANVELEPIYTGKIIEIQNIYYEFGSAKLEDEGKKSLRQLGTVMDDNPYLTVELGSHTDVRGKETANQKLSLKRAQSAVDFLTREMKIRKDRILANGYGESKIKNKCKSDVDCTEDEHAENRRTEIKILNIESHNYPLKSLYSMKKEEEFEKMVLSGGLETVGEGSKKEEDSTENEVLKEGFTKLEIEEGFNDDKLDELPQEKIVKAQEKSLTFETEDPNYQARMEEKAAQERIEMAKKNKEVEELPSKKEKFNGYRIVIYFNNFPLSEEHEIFKNFEDIEEYITREKNILYLTGKFNTEEEAEKFRLVYLEKKYPNSYVIQLKNGVRIK